MNRQIPTNDQQFKAWVQSVNDTLDKLTRGAQNAGRVSFGPQIQIGNILLTASATGDTLTLTNVVDGKHLTLTLV